MPVTKLDYRNFVKRVSCDVPTPKIVNLDIRDESPPNFSYELNGFLCDSPLTQSENTRSDNITIETPSEVPQLTSDKQTLTHCCKRNTDVTFRDLLNNIDAKIINSDQNIRDFSNSIFASLPNSSSFSMKLKNDSECGPHNLSDILCGVSIKDHDASIHNNLTSLPDNNFYSGELNGTSEIVVSNNLSDILSGISIQDYDTSTQKSFNRSVSPISNVSLNDIIVPNLYELENSNLKSNPVHDSSIKNSDLLTESSLNDKCNLSDILSPICIDNCNQTVLNKSAISASLHPVDKDVCVRYLNTVNETCKQPLSDFKTTLSEYNEDNFINSLSKLHSDDLNTPSLASLAKSHFLTNGSVKVLDEETKEYGNYLNSFPVSTEEINLASFVLHDNISTPNQTDFKNSVNSKEVLCDSSVDTIASNAKSFDNLNSDFGFTFFPESPRDHSSTSQTLLDNSIDGTKNAMPTDQNDKEENVSMLDLFNSLNALKHGDSNSSSLECNAIEKKENSISQDYISDNDDEVMSNIDLSVCVKSNENTQPLDLRKTVSTANVLKEIQPCLTIHISEDTLKYSLPLKNFSIPKTSHVNLKQSLFAKALSCKPKKDPTLIRKIASIKSELINNVLCHPMPVHSIPQDNTAAYSNECIISFSGRRIFAPRAPCQFL